MTTRSELVSGKWITNAQVRVTGLSALSLKQRPLDPNEGAVRTQDSDNIEQELLVFKTIPLTASTVSTPLTARIIPTIALIRKTISDASVGEKWCQ